LLTNKTLHMPDHLDGRRSHDSSRNRTHILLNRVIETFRHLNLSRYACSIPYVAPLSVVDCPTTKTSAIMRAVY